MEYDKLLDVHNRPILFMQDNVPVGYKRLEEEDVVLTYREDGQKLNKDE